MTTHIDQIDDHPLADALRSRYLNYSLSVITSRALPDVRDGLKPSQRRILVTMNDLGLGPESKFRKCAKICGDTMGNYHPHGDQAIYQTLVRMAQPFNLRLPLVEGQGNFGSLDGDNAASMRYTEARLQSLATELLREIRADTVDFRDNYDATRTEPIVLPARFPQLLVNGSSGIAVGMATSIPPHNLGEITEALLALIDRPDLPFSRLTKIIQGPDFPTGGTLVATRAEISEIYKTGQGSLSLRGEYTVEKASRGKKNLVFTSIPYGVNKSQILEKIGAHIAGKKVPQLIDVRDESTDEVRIVCELRSGADPEVAAAYLYRHTDLRSNQSVNLIALIPVEGEEGVLRPQRLDLREILGHFLDFRFEVVRRRLQFELRRLEERIHILEGFARIFDDLDAALRIIRRSDGKADAARKLMKKFDIDEIQADAILETKLYRLAKLEIAKILEELAAKKREARRIRSILRSRPKMAELIKKELREVARVHGDPRRTRIDAATPTVEFDPEAYIVQEDAFVVLTRDGRTKRQGTIRSVESIRTREGDEVISVVAGTTTQNVAYLSNLGSIYVARIADIPATTGHGEPIQKIFRFGDGERAIAAFSLDPRHRPPMPVEDAREVPGPHLLVATRRGYGFRFGLGSHLEVTTRNGRRFARLAAGDEVVSIVPVTGEEAFVAVTAGGRVLLAPVAEVSCLSGPGRGVIVQKVAADDSLIGLQTVLYEEDRVVVEKTTGGQARISAARYRVASRAGRGFELSKRGGIERLLPIPIALPSLGTTEALTHD